MPDGTSLEEKLNLTILEFYRGLTELAGQVRAGESQEQIATRVEQLAWGICRHWPICRDLHGDHPVAMAYRRKREGLK